MKYLLLFFCLSVLTSCRKNRVVYYDNGKPKYVNTWQNGILKFSRYDKEGKLLFEGKFKDQQLVDTLNIYDDSDNDTFVKIDSSDNTFFYGTFIAKYSHGKIAKFSLLRFEKGEDIDSIINSSVLYGKEELYTPDGKLDAVRYYKIVGDSSIKVSDKIIKMEK